MATLNKILVPTDFSENALAVYELAEEAAQNYNAKIDLIHIVPRLTYYRITRDSLGNEFQDKDQFAKIREQVEANLNTDFEKYLSAEVRGKAVVKHEDRVSRGIIKHARQEKYDLIISAARGRGKSEFLKGNVAEKLIRLANTPILTVNKDYDHEIDNIVMTTDGSRRSMMALPLALVVATIEKAPIELLAVSKSEHPMRSGSDRFYEHTDEEIKDFVTKALRDFVALDSNNLSLSSQLSPEKGESIELVDESGRTVDVGITVKKGESVYRTIISYANKNSDLVVMATHGRTGMKNLFLGSVTEKVVRHLKKPILTIRPKFNGE